MNGETGHPACTVAAGPHPCFQKQFSNGTPPSDAGWAGEIALDVEWSHAIAPAADILLVEAPSAANADLYSAVDVASASGAHVVSMSWGGRESASETTTDAHFKKAGVTFFASAGDSGHKTSYPATSPYVVGVGGTSAGSPQWAAIVALVDQVRTAGPLSSNSLTSSAEYSAAVGANYALNYRDIVTGTNGTCGAICTTNVGYDFVTGLGSPLANKLVPYLASH